MVSYDTNSCVQSRLYSPFVRRFDNAGNVIWRLIEPKVASWIEAK